MTGREWQPGDVVTHFDGMRGIVAERGRGCGKHLMPRDALHVHYDNGDWDIAAGARLHPLVVIDPEDREQVERLMRLFPPTWNLFPAGDPDAVEDAIIAGENALREFASPTPPKPDEPTGLGAVVEAIYNNHFVRAQSGDAPWVRVADDGNARSCSWAEIAVVKVLSPGVEAGESSC